MSIRHRTWTLKDGSESSSWVVDYYSQTGKRHVKSFKKKKDAVTFAAKTHVEVQGKVHVADADTITVEEAGKLWLVSCDSLERTTVAQYRQHLAYHICPLIGRKRLNEITIPSVRAFLDALRTTPYPADYPVARMRGKLRSTALIRAVRVSLGALLSDAMESGLVMSNAVKDMGRRRGKASSAARHVEQVQVGVDIPTTAEVRAMISAATGKARVFLMTAILTGMRASELRGLRWSDVDLDRREVTVRQRADSFNEIGSPKSIKGRRTIPLPGDLASTLEAWKDTCPPGELGLVFPSGTGRVEYHANIVKRWFQPAQVKAGVTVPGEGGKQEAKYTGLHSLRHFHASWLINRPVDGGLGLPPKVVQERLGHASIQMTLDVYSHLFPRGDDAGAMDSAATALIG